MPIGVGCAGRGAPRPRTWPSAPRSASSCADSSLARFSCGNACRRPAAPGKPASRAVLALSLRFTQCAVSIGVQMDSGTRFWYHLTTDERLPELWGFNNETRKTGSLGPVLENKHVRVEHPESGPGITPVPGFGKGEIPLRTPLFFASRHRPAGTGSRFPPCGTAHQSVN